MWSGFILPFLSPTLFVSSPNPRSVAEAEPGEGGLGSRYGLQFAGFRLNCVGLLFLFSHEAEAGENPRELVRILGTV